MCLQEEITPEIIANTICQDVYDGFYILVEGESDDLFYSKFLNSNVTQIEICHGKENVIEAISIISERQIKKDVSIALVDKDFDFLNSNQIHSNIIQTDFHDIEMMCLKSASFMNFSKEYFSSRKLKAIIGNASIKEYLLEMILPISKLRIISILEGLSLAFKASKNKERELDFSKFICKRKFIYKGDEYLLNAIKRYYNQATGLNNVEIIKKMQNLEIDKYNEYDMCHGHDLTRAIAIGLKQKIGRNSLTGVTVLEIERAMRLAYSIDDFNKTKMKAKLDSVDKRIVKKYVA